jgi:hypothetical protein
MINIPNKSHTQIKSQKLIDIAKLCFDVDLTDENTAVSTYYIKEALNLAFTAGEISNMKELLLTMKNAKHNV